MRHSDCSRNRLLATMEGLPVGLLLGLAFLALSLLRILGDTQSAQFGGRVLDATLEQPLWGTSLGLKLALYAGALLVVHLALGVLAWLLARISRAAWPGSRNGIGAWTALWGLLLMAWVLTANAAWFPSSSLGYPYRDVAVSRVLGLSILEIVSLLVWGGVLLTLCRYFGNRRQAIRPALFASTGAVCLGLGVGFVSGPVRDTWDSAGSPTDQPNVILIGFDSLRADHVGGAPGVSLTPEIDRFLSGATTFSDAITPLARTFPAWVSILSGKHPHSSGAVINLFPRDQIEEGETLPEIFRQHGYRTYYGIDEVRFSNVDESYGFDRMISPPIGSTDFLLGHFADTPLTNLLINTPVGRLLFPQIHGNRAMAVTYDPDTFIQMLDRVVRPYGPSFIAVHFTLPHWPYTWASGPPSLRGTGAIDDLMQAYPEAVSRADRQFGDLLALLDRKGALDNAIVVVLSDHGESLRDTLPIADRNNDEVVAYGHGTNVLAEDQYQVLLGIRAFGATAPVFAAGTQVDAPVSLEDIAPTIVDLLGFEVSQQFDGQSLLPLLASGPTEQHRRRTRFIETEFNPPGFNLNELAHASELTNAAKSYRIDPDTDRVLIREQRLDEILASRQYAVLRDGDLLASIPFGDGESQSLLFARAGSTVGWMSAVPDPDVDPVAAELWQSLIDRFEPVRRRPISSIAPW